MGEKHSLPFLCLLICPVRRRSSSFNQRRGISGRVSHAECSHQKSQSTCEMIERQCSCVNRAQSMQYRQRGPADWLRKSVGGVSDLGHPYRSRSRGFPAEVLCGARTLHLRAISHRHRQRKSAQSAAVVPAAFSYYLHANATVRCSPFADQFGGQTRRRYTLGAQRMAQSLKIDLEWCHENRFGFLSKGESSIKPVKNARYLYP
jgi:hypothetical protein